MRSLAPSGPRTRSEMGPPPGACAAPPRSTGRRSVSENVLLRFPCSEPPLSVDGACDFRSASVVLKVYLKSSGRSFFVHAVHRGGGSPGERLRLGDPLLRGGRVAPGARARPVARRARLGARGGSAAPDGRISEGRW